MEYSNRGAAFISCPAFSLTGVGEPIAASTFLMDHQSIDPLRTVGTESFEIVFHSFCLHEWLACVSVRLILRRVLRICGLRRNRKVVSLLKRYESTDPNQISEASLSSSHVFFAE